MKKLAALLLSAILVFSLAACSGGNGGDDNQSTGTSASSKNSKKTSGSSKSSSSKSKTSSKTDETSKKVEKATEKTKKVTENSLDKVDITASVRAKIDSKKPKMYSGTAKNDDIKKKLYDFTKKIEGYDRLDSKTNALVSDPTTAKIQVKDKDGKKYSVYLGLLYTTNQSDKGTPVYVIEGISDGKNKYVCYKRADKDKSEKEFRDLLISNFK